jgi:hypothetical protein
MKYILYLLFLASCGYRSSNEMEDMTRDVLKYRQGVDIEVKPLPKEEATKKPCKHQRNIAP